VRSRLRLLASGRQQALRAGCGWLPGLVQVWVKVLPLGLIFFVASFNLTILQNLKDAIMVTTAGAETLPFLASCVVLPASLAFFMAYGKMVEALPSRSVFYAALAPLVAFYILFTAVLYPMHGSLHLNGFYAATAPLVPAGLHGLLKVVEYWTFSLFYCASELWGSVAISVLFWSLANEVCTVSEAKVRGAAGVLGVGWEELRKGEGGGLFG
jgi:AAA family ATP:ADP antiporter